MTTELQSVDVVAGHFDRVAAARAVGRVAQAEAHVERCVYYPYHWYRVAGSAPSWLGRRKVALGCLVDARSGVARTADEFDVEKSVVPVGDLMQPNKDSVTAEREAQRYVSHALGRNLRTIANFDIELDHCGVVYKAFWILRCGETRVLLDSASGELQVLSQGLPTPV